MQYASTIIVSHLEWNVKREISKSAIFVHCKNRGARGQTGGGRWHLGQLAAACASTHAAYKTQGFAQCFGRRKVGGAARRCLVV